MRALTHGVADARRNAAPSAISVTSVRDENQGQLTAARSASTCRCFVSQILAGCAHSIMMDVRSSSENDSTR